LKHTTHPLRPSELISSPPRLSETKLSLIKKHSVLERREKPADIMAQTCLIVLFVREGKILEEGKKIGNDIKDVSGKRRDNK